MDRGLRDEAGRWAMAFCNQEQESSSGFIGQAALDDDQLGVGLQSLVSPRLSELRSYFAHWTATRSVLLTFGSQPPLNSR